MFTGLRITNVWARDVTGSAILLEAVGKEKGTLTDYIITGNLAAVDDRIKGTRARLANNQP